MGVRRTECCCEDSSRTDWAWGVAVGAAGVEGMLGIRVTTGLVHGLLLVVGMQWPVRLCWAGGDGRVTGGAWGVRPVPYLGGGRVWGLGASLEGVLGAVFYVTWILYPLRENSLESNHVNRRNEPY